MKKKTIFKGAATALVTPMRDGKIDYTALGALIDKQIEAGISALVIGGTTGEAATLCDGERYEMYTFAKAKISGRTKLILGTGTNDTRVALKHTRFAETLGCDGALLVTPYYNKGTEDGITRHYLTIAESTSLPIILYNVPSRTGVNLDFPVLDRLAREKNIVAIKEASDSLDRLVRLSGYGEDLRVYAGNDSQIYPVLALGGLGVISVVSNILPKEASDICNLYFNGKTGESLMLQNKLLALIRALFLETNPAPVKFVLSELGLIENELRLPLSRVKKSTEEAVHRALAELSDDTQISH